MKTFFIILAVLLVIAGSLIFIYRYEIFRYSAQKVILAMLPPYLKADEIRFDLEHNEIEITNAHIANPQGFSDNPVLSVGSIFCTYALKGKNVFGGITVTNLEGRRPVVRIERSRDGRINVFEMKDLMKSGEGRAAGRTAAPKGAGGPIRIGSRKPSELLTLPEVITLSEGNIRFVDYTAGERPRVLTFDRIESRVSLKMNEDFSKVLDLRSTGSGIFHRKQDQTLEWTIAFIPTTPGLTMSNRFKVIRVDILPFQPYFARFSPLVFTSGKFSGNLVIDFDNGSIGSMNTVWLEELGFSVKPGHEDAQFWQTTVPELTKYLSSVAPGSGATVFDFKVKGPLSKPSFYLGPITKKALTSMIVDRTLSSITKIIQGTGSGPKLDDAQEVINALQSIMAK